ncbi:hypothetical protein STANM309S_03634 [Streptomyces tanashiensis]
MQPHVPLACQLCARVRGIRDSGLVGGLLSIEESIQNTDTASPSEPETVAETAPPVRSSRRRVLRTVGLIAVAAVIGLVGGTAVGYGMQADREPTALPPLNQPGLAYPAKALPKGQTPEPPAAKDDRQAKAQGDLAEVVLLPKPAGAKKGEFGPSDGWMPVYEFASQFKKPGNALDYQLGLGVRRVAAAAWTVGEYRSTEIRLIQYRANDTLGAQEYVEDQQAYMPEEDFAGNEGKELEGLVRRPLLPLPRGAEGRLPGLLRGQGLFPPR